MSSIPFRTLVVAIVVVACASDPPRYSYVPPPAESRVDVRATFTAAAEAAYAQISQDYQVVGRVPSRDSELARACEGLPPLIPTTVPKGSDAALRAERCGSYAAAVRFRAELDRGNVPCAPADDACALRRARIEVEEASGARFASKSPDCATLVVRYRHWLESSNDWATCDAFAVFEKLQISENSSWSSSEFRECLAPHVAAFPALVRCLPQSPPPDLPPPQLLEPEEVRVAADDLLRLLDSNDVQCSGLLGETRLAKADGIARWTSLSGTIRGPLIRDSIAARYGPGILEQALSRARTAVAEFRSELCLVRR